MKIMNSKLAIIFTLLLVTLSKAQILPLNTPVYDIPANAYVKDLNNELGPYVGTYKATFQGREITLFITKVGDRPTTYFKINYFQDALVVKYIVKDSSGNILQDTKNNSNPRINLYSIKSILAKNTVTFVYSGTNCRVGWGTVSMKKINDNQISWEYRPNDIIIDNKTCPPGTDIKIYLPETKDLVFTKQ